MATPHLVLIPWRNLHLHEHSNFVFSVPVCWQEFSDHFLSASAIWYWQRSR